jgi:hypothetical protein
MATRLRVKTLIGTLVGTLAVCAALLAGSFGSVALAQSDKDCSDFRTQHQAQKYFKKHGGSRHNNVDDLDADHDGIACEDLP